jgi:hypothetical protein
LQFTSEAAAAQKQKTIHKVHLNLLSIGKTKTGLIVHLNNKEHHFMTQGGRAHVGVLLGAWDFQ